MMSNEGDDVKAATYHSSYVELRFLIVCVHVRGEDTFLGFLSKEPLSISSTPETGII